MARDHVVVDASGEKPAMLCRNCGVTEPLALPAAIRDMVKQADAWSGKHASCKRRYLCERCGGTGQQPAGCWDGKAYAAPAGTCTDCKGSGRLGVVGETFPPKLEPLTVEVAAKLVPGVSKLMVVHRSGSLYLGDVVTVQRVVAETGMVMVAGGWWDMDRFALATGKGAATALADAKPGEIIGHASLRYVGRAKPPAYMVEELMGEPEPPPTWPTDGEPAEDDVPGV